MKAARSGKRTPWSRGRQHPASSHFLVGGHSGHLIHFHHRSYRAFLHCADIEHPAGVTLEVDGSLICRLYQPPVPVMLQAATENVVLRPGCLARPCQPVVEGFALLAVLCEFFEECDLAGIRDSGLFHFVVVPTDLPCTCRAPCDGDGEILLCQLDVSSSPSKYCA